MVVAVAGNVSQHDIRQLNTSRVGKLGAGGSDASGSIGLGIAALTESKGQPRVADIVADFVFPQPFIPELEGMLALDSW